MFPAIQRWCGVVLVCGVVMTAAARDRFTEVFSGNFDLVGSTFTFKPDFSTNGYAVCRLPANDFPTTNYGLPLLQWSGATVWSFPYQRGFTFYGRTFQSVRVHANGFLTFSFEDDPELLTVSNHFARPRITALNAPMAPSGASPVYYVELEDRVAFTWPGVPNPENTHHNAFQVELFFTGEIRLTYLAVGASNVFVGLSDGSGMPTPFIETDLSEVGCAGKALYRFELGALPPVLTAGAGYAFSISGRDAFNLPFPVSETVHLSAKVPNTIVFKADFENGPDNFSVSNHPAGATNHWHRTNTRGLEFGHSGQFSFSFGPSTRSNVPARVVAEQAESVLRSPVIDLRDAVAPITLEFNHAGRTDSQEVQVELDGTNVVHLGYPLNASYEPSTWNRTRMDLSRFAGRELRLRFVARSESYSFLQRGWWIDDVEVRATAGRLPMAPQVAAPFAGSDWNGAVYFSNPAPAVVLVVTSGSNVVSLTPPFAVVKENDLTLTATVSTQHVLAGGTVVLTAWVTNPGPAAIGPVFLTNFTPAGAVIANANPSQGSHAAIPNGRLFSLGTLAAGTGATAEMTVSLPEPSIAALRSQIGASSASEFSGNNAVTNHVLVGMPGLSGEDAIAWEADTLYFPVYVNPPPLEPVFLYFETADGTAKAGEDYVATNGWAIVEPGTNRIYLPVRLLAGGGYEGGPFRYEQFTFSIHTTNAAPPGLDLIGSIRDQETSAPQLLPGSATLVEGDSGISTGYVECALTAPVGFDLTLSVVTVTGPAFVSLGFDIFAGNAGSNDFVSFSTNLVIPAGATQFNLPVFVRGDTEHESHERFSYRIHSPQLLGTRARFGSITIQDDDAPTFGADDWRLVQENCATPNGAIDPGETVTIELRTRHTGFHTIASNVVVTLHSTNNVRVHSGARMTGALLPGGPPEWLPFTFTAEGLCGTNLSLPLSFRNGSLETTATLSVPVGKRSVTWSEDFDSLTTNFPSGWSNGFSRPWEFSSHADSGTNAARIWLYWSYDFASLFSPAITIQSTNAALTFRQSYDFSDCCGLNGLHLQIGDETPQLWTNAGGVFLQSPPEANGSWYGEVRGFETVVAQLPASAAGKQVRFVWTGYRFTSTSGAPTSWTIDSIRLLDGPVTCCDGSLAPWFSAVERRTNSVVLRWQAMPGRQYRVEHTTTLQASAPWQEVSGTLTAQESTMSFTNSGSTSVGFFRVRLLP